MMLSKSNLYSFASWLCLATCLIFRLIGKPVTMDMIYLLLLGIFAEVESIKAKLDGR